MRVEAGCFVSLLLCITELVCSNLLDGVEKLEDLLGVLNPHVHPEGQESMEEELIRGDKIYWTDKELNQVKSMTETRELRNERLSPSVYQELTPAQDRQMFLSEKFDLSFIENKYTELLESLPTLIDTAVEVITETAATKTMLGYTMIVGFMVGAVLDTVALVTLAPNSLGQAVALIVTDKYYQGVLHFLWWYAFGFSGPWMFPGTFGQGLPDIEVSSKDFFHLVRDYNLSLNIQSFTDKSPVAAVLLRENVKRDFNRRFAPVISRGEFAESERVIDTFNQLLSLVHYHSHLAGPPPQPSQTDLQLLDQSLEQLWDEMILMEDEVRVEIKARKAQTTTINIFIALLNVAGMIGGVVMGSGRASRELGEDELSKIEKKEKDFTDLVSDVVYWLFKEDHPSLYVKELGAAAMTTAPLAWGYSYIFPYLLFLESLEPSCGPGDKIYAKYEDLRSVRRLLEDGRRVGVRWRVDRWWQEIQEGLHCLLNTEEGVRLTNTIDMFHVLATHRINLSSDL